MALDTGVIKIQTFRSISVLIFIVLPHLATAEGTDGSVDWIGGATRRENSNGRLLYGQCGTVGIDKTQRPEVVHVRGGTQERRCVCVCVCG